MALPYCKLCSTVIHLALLILLQECDFCLSLLVCWQKVHLHCCNDCGHSVLSGRHQCFRDFLFLCSMMPLCAVPYLVIATKNRVSL